MQISTLIPHYNETLATYIHHFKTAAKWGAFDNDTVAICIFIKGLRDASTIASKIYEKDPQTLAEVIRLIEKLSAAHQLAITHLLLQSEWCQVMISVLSVDGEVIFATTDLKPSNMAVMNLAILPRIVPTRFLHQEHHASMEDLVQGINTPASRGTDHTPIMVPDIGDITADHSATPLSHCDRSHNFIRHTSSSSSSHCSNCTHHFSCRHHSQHSMDWSHTHSHTRFSTKKDKAMPKTSTPINPPPQNCHHHRFLFRIFIRLWQWCWFFKLLGPSPSSEEDEWRWHFSNHYTTELVSDCPTVTVHAGKRFKTLTDSGAALSLVHTCVNNMIDDQYKTKIPSAAVFLRHQMDHVMYSLGKVTVHLHIANFKVSHTFVICDKLLDIDILFGIDTQKRYTLSYSWNANKQLFIQREGSFVTYTRNCEQQHNIAVVKSPLKIPLRHNGIIPFTIKGHNSKSPVG